MTHGESKKRKSEWSHGIKSIYSYHTKNMHAGRDLTEWGNMTSFHDIRKWMHWEEKSRVWLWRAAITRRGGCDWIRWGDHAIKLDWLHWSLSSHRHWSSNFRVWWSCDLIKNNHVMFFPPQLTLKAQCVRFSGIQWSESGLQTMLILIRIFWPPTGSHIALRPAVMSWIMKHRAHPHSELL